jgi:2-aminoadipate transaminase
LCGRALAGLASPRQLHYAGQNGSGGVAAMATNYANLLMVGTNKEQGETPFMTSAVFDFAPLLPAGLPAPAAKWTGLAKYSFVGGNNDPDQVPLEGLIDAVNAVLRREGKTLATYGLASGPQGYLPLRQFLTAKLKADAGISCAADDILIVSGSLQALDLVNAMLLARGDTVIIERDSYQGAINRLTRLGVNVVGIPLDHEGMRMDALAEALADLKGRGITPKYIYTIPTVQNPTGTIMPLARRTELLRLAEQYGVPIFEDDCYADLIWDGQRPPAIHAMSQTGNVIHIGSFSKSIAPALRVGYIVAGWGVMSRMLSLKTDAGSGALEQMVLAEYCAPHFNTHVPKLTRGLRAKLETLMEALNEQFGTSAEFEDPKGGIFLWVKLPDQVDTLKLYQAALVAGVSINPGPEWSTDKAYAGSRLRLCFASPTHEEIREGIALLAEVCHREFGVPARSANIEKRGRA